MNEGAKLLEHRIGALIERLRALAAERDEFVRERETLRSRMSVGERENGRLRTVLEEAVSELRQE